MSKRTNHKEKNMFVIEYEGKFFTGRVIDVTLELSGALEFGGRGTAKIYVSKAEAEKDFSLSHPKFGNLWADGPKIRRIRWTT